jgi:hypothetical protein
MVYTSCKQINILYHKIHILNKDIKMCCGNENQFQSKLILNAKHKFSFPNWIETNFQPISPHGDHNMWKMIKLYICAIKIYANLFEFLVPIVF